MFLLIPLVFYGLSNNTILWDWRKVNKYSVNGFAPFCPFDSLFGIRNTPNSYKTRTASSFDEKTVLASSVSGWSVSLPSGRLLSVDLLPAISIATVWNTSFYWFFVGITDICCRYSNLLWPSSSMKCLVFSEPKSIVGLHHRFAPFGSHSFAGVSHILVVCLPPGKPGWK